MQEAVVEMPVVRTSGSGRGRRAALWALAFAGTLAAASYQRLTGPTFPLFGHVTIGEGDYRYRLPRSGVTTEDRRVALPLTPAVTAGRLVHRRVPTDDPFTSIPLAREGDRLVGYLPRQPAAGKVEYYVVLESGDGEIRLPSGQSSAVLRFKDPVPAWLLLPHIALMFTAVFVGIRAGLGALWSPEGLGRLAGVTLATLTAGGLILGPIVQKLAFGSFWTGYPFGKDLTDDKTVVMWAAWVAAAVVLRRVPAGRARLRRGVVLLAAALMLAVYLVPHSVLGSELDYSQLDRGATPVDAVRTGPSP